MTREEVPPLASDLDEGADKEANSPAGGAWGVGGVVEGGSFQFSQDGLRLVTGACSWGRLLSSVMTSP